MLTVDRFTKIVRNSLMCDPEERTTLHDLRVFEELDLNIQLFILDFLKSKIYFEEFQKILKIDRETFCNMRMYDIFQKVADLEESELDELKDLIIEYQHRKF